MTIHAKHQMTTRTRMMGVVGDSNSEKNKNPIMAAPTKSKSGNTHKATY